mgnify:CR=1 FL=1
MDDGMSTRRCKMTPVLQCCTIAIAFGWLTLLAAILFEPSLSIGGKLALCGADLFISGLVMGVVEINDQKEHE